VIEFQSTTPKQKIFSVGGVALRSSAIPAVDPTDSPRLEVINRAHHLQAPASGHFRQLRAPGQEVVDGLPDIFLHRGIHQLLTAHFWVLPAGFLDRLADVLHQTGHDRVERFLFNHGRDGAASRVA
jgi:hypothetical protein